MGDKDKACGCGCSGSGAVPTAKALELAELVAYSNGSIVSRTIADSKAGTLTLFAFDQGQGLSEHSAPFDAFVQVLDGQGEFVIGGESVVAEVGCLVVMPADVPHAVKANVRFKMLLTMLRATE